LKISSTQRSQVARSGGIDTCRSLLAALGTIWNSPFDSAGIRSHSIAEIAAAGGGDERRRCWKVSSELGGPKASISTPLELLRMRPAMPSS
jgi:hypothetical protein